ncbi:hypothetical protein EYF80_020087 [Liparis tanakae]|uniref:Uncharacterized protein n=1 Tax=Liparis tanakae TaxID=230148 RepID=A0A4Z2HXM4_9TELE|nr:hypothetical protein EYF80_020087 [Liparis tanakae]
MPVCVEGPSAPAPGTQFVRHCRSKRRPGPGPPEPLRGDDITTWKLMHFDVLIHKKLLRAKLRQNQIRVSPDECFRDTTSQLTQGLGGGVKGNTCSPGPVDAEDYWEIWVTFYLLRPDARTHTPAELSGARDGERRRNT